MNAKLPCKTKALPPPLCPAFVIYLSVAHCSPEKKERDRESENKRANKVKVNPLVYCSYSLYSSACNYYWKINIFFIPVERNYCYKIKKTALPLALTIYIYIFIYVIIISISVFVNSFSAFIIQFRRTLLGILLCNLFGIVNLLCSSFFYPLYKSWYLLLSSSI